MTGTAGWARRRPCPGGPPVDGHDEMGERRVLDEVADPGGDARRPAPWPSRIARRLGVRPRRRDRLATRGSGQLLSVPYRYGSDEIDLDRTLEVLTERPVPEDTDIVVRERMRAAGRWS